MKSTLRFPRPLLALGAMAFAAGCTTVQAQDTNPRVQNDPVKQQSEVKSVTIDLPPKGVFSVIGFDYLRTDEAKAARAEFQSSAIPIAVQNGFTRHAALIMDGISVGPFQPQGFLLTTWPDWEAFERFESDPRWPEYSELRKDIWSDIRYYRDVQDEGLSLTLRSDKSYTLAIAHTDPENTADYQQYLARLEDEVVKQGGRFVLKLYDPVLESLSGAEAPNQLTFIEWNDAEGPRRLLQSETYKSVRHLAATGTTQLAFYRLRPSI